MQQTDKSWPSVPQSGVKFKAPLVIAGYTASRTCALSTGCQVFIVADGVSHNETVLQFFLSCGFTVSIFNSLQDACLGIEHALRCDLLFLDADSCADVVSTHEILVKLQTAVPKLPVIVGSANVYTGRHNPVLNYLLNTVVCLPIDDRGLLNAVAVAVANSLR